MRFQITLGILSGLMHVNTGGCDETNEHMQGMKHIENFGALIIIFTYKLICNLLNGRGYAAIMKVYLV